MKFFADSLAENVLPNNGKRIVVRVMGEVNIGGEVYYRVTDNLNCGDYSRIIRENQSWAVPAENLIPHYTEDCAVCHRDGLVWIK